MKNRHNLWRRMAFALCCAILLSTTAMTSAEARELTTVTKSGGKNQAKEKKAHPHYTVHLQSGSKRLADEYQDYLYEMCEKYGISDYYGLILTQMCVESGYNQTALSPTKNYGLMQISMAHFPRLQSALGLTDLRDPKQNIEAGVYMMAGYLSRYGDAQAALVCYHCGESAAKRGIRSDYYSKHIVSLLSGLEEA